MRVRVTNIQRFCLNDGPGIRTTVFLKGCNLRCPWCANPENMEYSMTKYTRENEVGVFGRDMNIQELFDEIVKDKEYFSVNSGGVTFSGGEALLQAKALEPLLKMLKDNNINVCFETALMVPSELLELVMPYVDYFIVDIKILDADKVRDVLGGNLNLYYRNLDLLSKNGTLLTFRIPLVNEYTLNDDNVDSIIQLLEEYSCQKCEIFKVHNLAESKYKSIGKEIVKFTKVSDKDVLRVYKRIKDSGINVEIIKI